jgi:Fuc2NAc and GlcNAc transferase
MLAGVLFIAALLFTYVGVGLFRRWSVKNNFLDMPNERSSHSMPTPRGGGIVIAAVCIIAYVVLSIIYPAAFSWGYLLGVILIVTISWLDDVYSIWFLWRLLAHAAAAAIFLVDSQITHGDSGYGLFGVTASFFWIVWLINAYNFMDGIDGIAALQAVVTSASWLILCLILETPAMFYLSGVIAFASIGFLAHNWPPSKIFMGDVGSAFFGYTFGILPFLTDKEAPKSLDFLPLIAMFFLWFFLFDTGVTFLRRLLRGKNVFSAHREHIYQLMVISGYSHCKVTLIYGVLAAVLNVLVLLSGGFRNEVGLAIFSVTAILTFVLILSYLLKPQGKITK